MAKGGSESETPFRLTPKGANQDEIVANGSMDRGYQLQGLSKVLFARVYRDALLKAGWSIKYESGNHEVIVAHYAKNGRNIWAYLLDHGAEYLIRVGKEAAPNQMKASAIPGDRSHVPGFGRVVMNRAPMRHECGLSRVIGQLAQARYRQKECNEYDPDSRKEHAGILRGFRGHSTGEASSQSPS